MNLFTKDEQKIINNGGIVTREFMINKDRHIIEFSLGKVVEKVNGIVMLIIGEQ